MLNRVVVAMLMVVLCASTVWAQQAAVDDRIVVHKSDLPAGLADQLAAKTKAEETMAKFEAFGEWAGKGHEIGVAFREGLSAITEETVTFSETKVGRFTMFLIAYKVMGTDALQILVGLFFAILFTPLFVWSFWKSAIPRRVLTSIEGGKKTYELFDPDGYVKWGHAGVMAIFIIIECIVFFA